MHVERRNAVALTISAFIFALLIVLAWRAFPPREPVYQGKTLTVWLKQYGANHWSATNQGLEKEAQTAIRKIGTNAHPHLLKMMTTRESPLRIKLMSWVSSKWLARLHLPSVNGYRRSISERRRLGAYGWIALDSDAHSAVPNLIALIGDKQPDVRYVAVFTLRCLGPVASNAVPALLQCLTD